MSRCEDYPCCGHEAGGCPDLDGRFRCARCGGKLPRRATSAVCARCHADWRRGWARGEDDMADREDGDLALREGPAASFAGPVARSGRWEMTTQREMRRVFWATFPGLSRRRGLDGEFPTGTRVVWVDWVDWVEREGRIGRGLARRATLGG